MDISKTYILQCEKAWKHLKRQIYFHDIVLIKSPNGQSNVGTNWIEKSPMFYKYIENERYIEPLEHGMCQAQDCKGFVIWKQDQLQGIAQEHLMTGTTGLIRLFNGFFESLELEDFPGKFNSMEQLWLAFVMAEKYQKHWNEKEWVK